MADTGAGVAPNAEATGEVATETDMVAVEEASDEDLHAFLNDAKSKGAFNREEEEGDDDEEAEAPARQTRQKSPEKKEDDSEGDEKEEEETPSESVTMTRAEYERLQGDLAKNEKLVKHKEQFIQSKLSELKGTKKQLLELKAQLESKLEDSFAESPAKGLKEHQQIQEIEQNIEALDNQESLMNHVTHTHEYVRQHVDLEKVQVDDVRDALKEKGATDEYIEAFVKNPYAHATGDALIHFFDAVQYRSVLKRLVPAFKKMAEENKSLKAKPHKLMQQISKSAESSPQITGKSGNANGRRGIADVDPTKLSDTDLKELAKELGLTA